MADLDGFLQLKSESGRCYEIINGARTLSHVQAGKASNYWLMNSTYWEGLDSWAFDEGDYQSGENPDPWYDPQKPASCEVFGFMPDAPGNGTGFFVESPMSNRIFSDDGRPPMEMYVTGSIVAATRRGENHWKEWFYRSMADCCSRCDGWSAAVFNQTPCRDDILPYLQASEPPVYPVVDPGAPASTTVCDPDPPKLAAYSATLPEEIDDGYRELLKVRFVGLDPLAGSFKHPLCAGGRYQMRFEVDHPAWYSRPVTIGEILSTSWVACDSMFEPFDICSTTVTAASGCGPADTFQRRRSFTRETKWVQPSCYLRQAFLTAPLPWTTTGRLSVEISNGEKPVYNARLTVWPAVDGLPSPATDVGRVAYKNQPPAWQVLIPEMLAGQTIKLDGPTGSASLICSTGESRSGGGIVESASGPRWKPPALKCDDRFWVALDLAEGDGQEGARDLSAKVNLVREEIVG